MKTFLVAVSMLVGTSAWAGDWATVYSNNYETTATISDILSGDYKDCQIEVGANHYLKVRENGRNGGSKTMSFPDYSTYGKFEVSFKVGFYTSNNKGSSFQIRNGSTALATFSWGTWTDAGATVSYKIGETVQTETLTATKQSSSTRNSDTNNSIAKWYTFTISGNSDDNKVFLTVNDGSSNVINNSEISATYKIVTSLYFNLGNAHAEIGFDDMLVRVYSDTEVVSDPTFDVAYAGENRTVTITSGTSSVGDAVVTTYYTTNGDTPTSSSSVYSAPLNISENCTIKAVSISNKGGQSDIMVQEVTVGKLSLSIPTISASGFTNADGQSVNNPTFNFASDNTAVLGTPVATLSYIFTPDGGVESAATAGSSYTPTGYGTLKVIASADGYTSSEKTLTVSNFYPVSFAGRDYTTASNSDDFTTWGDATNVSWTGWADGLTACLSATVVSDDYRLNIQNASTISLVLGWGWVRGDQKAYGYRSRHSKEGNFVALKENTSKGADADATTYQTLYCTVGTGSVTDLITINVPASYAVQQLFHYSPAPAAVTKAITSAGWATYCSPFALDFSEDIANLTDVYIVTGSTGSSLELTSVKGGTVPANTGLLIEGTAGDVVIPIAATSATDVSANKLVGVTAETALAAESGYVLMGSPSVGFYKNTNAFTVGANTAYLPIDFDAAIVPSDARNFYGFGEVTGIGATLKNKEIENKEVYNLKGQRVAAPTKGLYIQNGKKVVVK